MKILKFSLLSSLVSILLFSSCSTLPLNRNEQVNVTRSININSFTGIRLQTSANVEITEGEKFSIVATGPENIVSQIEALTIDNDGILTILYEQVYRNTQVDISITMPSVQYLENRRTGKIVGRNTFKTENLNIKLLGTGNIEVAVDVVEVGVNLIGTGNVILSGKTSKLNDDHKGTGHLLAFDLNAEKVWLWSFGTGHIKVWAVASLECGLYGTGSIFYQGHPTIDSQIKGTGALVNAN